MIVKILSRHTPSYSSLIKYILREDKGEKLQFFTHNLRSNSIQGWTQEYLVNESFRKSNRSDQVYLYHDILSFSANEDSAMITPELLASIAQKYIELRGFEGMYIGAVHRDKTHVHVHFCTSGVAFRTGKAMRLSRSKLHTLKMDLQNYHTHKYAELNQSICDHGSGKAYLTDREWQTKHNGRRNLVKADIFNVVTSCFSKATSQKEFLSLLRDSGLHHYERNGKAQGITSDTGMKFRFSRLGIDLGALRKDNREEQNMLRALFALRKERDTDISREY